MREPFRCKQFSVQHDACAMKVGTDAILLGAWASLPTIRAQPRILDIGTGSGIIALMLAQRCLTATIRAVDIDGPSIQQAEQNFRASPWADRMIANSTAIQAYSDSGFDLIVSNPPYFQNDSRAAIQQRSLARHADALPFADLIHHSARLLNQDGRLSIIVPADAIPQIRELATGCGLFPVRCCNVRPLPDRPPKRTLIEFANTSQTRVANEPDLFLEFEHHVYTPQFAQLAGDFLLQF